MKCYVLFLQKVCYWTIVLSLIEPDNSCAGNGSFSGLMPPCSLTGWYTKKRGMKESEVLGHFFNVPNYAFYHLYQTFYPLYQTMPLASCTKVCPMPLIPLHQTMYFTICINLCLLPHAQRICLYPMFKLLVFTQCTMICLYPMFILCLLPYAVTYAFTPCTKQWRLPNSPAYAFTPCSNYVYYPMH